MGGAGSRLVVVLVSSLAVRRTRFVSKSSDWTGSQPPDPKRFCLVDNLKGLDFVASRDF